MLRTRQAVAEERIREIDSAIESFHFINPMKKIPHEWYDERAELEAFLRKHKESQPVYRKIVSIYPDKASEVVAHVRAKNEQVFAFLRELIEDTHVYTVLNISKEEFDDAAN